MTQQLSHSTQTGHRGSPGKVALASFIGTSIEWYDFFLYGTASALVFGALFFPSEDPIIGTLLAFGSFGVGFAARPLGGAIFGNLADRIGRKKVLVTTLLIMGIATAAIGLLPTFDQIGVWAPILLVVLRLVQGIGVGGEWGAAVMMSVEHAPEGRKGFFGSIPQMGVPTGTILSTGAFALLAQLPEDQFLAWGWRLPFLASFLLVLVGLFIRVSIEESPEFQDVASAGRVQKMPLAVAVRGHWRSILAAAGTRFSENSSFYVVTVFSITYGVEALGLDRSLILNAVLICAFIEFLLIPAFGRWSEKLGHRKLFLWAAAASVLVAFPYFLLFNTGNFAVIATAMSLTVGIACIMFALEPVIMGALFPAEIRTSAVSIGYQVAAVFAGGLSPFIATGLYTLFDGAWWPVAAYLALMGVISFASMWLAPAAARRERDGVRGKNNSPQCASPSE
ncbi:MFS transporter [Leucobacter manosquensis]|uniref:MHS family MFS transporter n=1 Tax=Leucobacter manosquensis TaxID=2810611 RepID=A0ABS5M629_9MICO|nr:MFS transporter [Leucobacter manosquensis]MBS3182450.1 MHS family MFS transporter [Leucobacter manosquensis]